MTTSGQTATPEAEHETPNYGAVIRQRRKALGMTLDDVAKATNLTIGFLSQVERGISSPSLSSFMRIAGALQTSLEQLIKVPEPYSEYVSKDARQTYVLGKSKRLYEKLGPGFPGALTYPCIIHRPPGHVSEHMQHEGEVFCYLLSGSLEYHLGNNVFILTPGDCIHHDTSKPHFSKVLGDEESEELWVSSAPIKDSGG
ncbi:MAG: XRE family transcriptional regulator [Roseibium sp.]|uniref:helix-turn-helix domain-containing protein n=1 Tax=Roseibium sp. TaxID=1936156 RepID=UPI00263578F2|nr:XRE family transcriptional regulator [Roseibium sp.]MCV0425542.1 XRE family transcriptional regulator [Roseibium sp.]